MKSIIMVSHGTLAKGVYQAASMIYGELKNVDYLCLEESMGVDFFKGKLSELIESVKDSRQIVVFTDLKGGSPYTSALTILSEEKLLEKSKIISGLNLSMILSALFIEGTVGEEEVIEIINASKDGIDVFEIEEDTNDEL